MSPDPTIAASSPNDPQDGDASTVQPPVPELEVLARLLSDRRQAQGLSVVDLAQRLHMGVEQLKALERGDLQQLPEPVFVIAQARRVADALGIEISAQIEALRRSERFMANRPALKTEVLQTTAGRQRSDEAAQPEAKPNPSQPKGQGGGPTLVQPAERFPAGRLLAWLLLLAGVVAAGTWGWQQRERAQPTLAMALQQLSRLAPPARQPVSAPPAPKPRPQPFAASAIQPAELLVSARQPSWLEVRPAAGGQPLFRGTFIGERRFPLAAGLRLRAGRPDLVRISVGSAPPKPLGTISQIRWVTFKAPDQVKGAIKPPAQKPVAAPQS